MSGDLETSGLNFGVELTRQLESFARSIRAGIGEYIDSCMSIFNLQRDDEIKAARGITVIVLDKPYGLSSAEAKRRNKVGTWLIAPIGADIVKDAGFTSLETMYQAARAIKMESVSLYDALEIFSKMTASEAIEFNKKPKKEKDLQFTGWRNPNILLPEEVCAALESGVISASEKCPSFSQTQIVERIAGFLTDADPENLEILLNVAEQGSAGVE